jgi:hypothetical protein
MSVKNSCSSLIAKLEACASNCEKYIKTLIPKLHCIQPAKDVSSLGKNFVAACKQHMAACQNSECKQACSGCVQLVEKAIEKSTACADACGGAGSDSDCQIVCKDCAVACRAASQACKGAMSKICA